MVTKPKFCAFCKHRLDNTRLLKEHLLKYTGTWRYPADGINNVSAIKNLFITRDCFDNDDNDVQKKDARKKKKKRESPNTNAHLYGSL